MGSNKPEQTEIPASQVQTGLNEGVRGADIARADGLDNIFELCQAMDRGLQREHAQLRARLGADHPKVQEIGQRIATNQVFGQQVSLEAQQARFVDPVAAENAWAVYGRVLGADLLPAAGLTAALFDARKNRVPRLGCDITNENGFFTIQSPDVGTGQQSPVFLGLLNEQGQLIYFDENCPLTPAGGQVVNRGDVFLTSTTPICTPGGKPPGGEPPGGEPPGTIQIESITIRNQNQDSQGNYLIGGGTSATGVVRLTAVPAQPITVQLTVTETHRDVISVEPLTLVFSAARESEFTIRTQRVFVSRHVAIAATLERTTRSVAVTLLPRRLAAP